MLTALVCLLAAVLAVMIGVTVGAVLLATRRAMPKVRA